MARIIYIILIFVWIYLFIELLLHLLLNRLRIRFRNVIITGKDRLPEIDAGGLAKFIK